MGISRDTHSRSDQTARPDVAFLSYDRLAYEEDDAAQIPYMAPDVAVEIVSPSDRRVDIDEKIRVYLAAGASLVVLIDPSEHTLTTYDSEGTRHFARDEIFEHLALPGLALEVASIFEKPKPRKS